MHDTSDWPLAEQHQQGLDLIHDRKLAYPMEDPPKPLPLAKTPDSRRAVHEVCDLFSHALRAGVST
jgi:hypothetical protein